LDAKDIFFHALREIPGILDIPSRYGNRKGVFRAAN
jgi:hypothetical protein